MTEATLTNRVQNIVGGTKDTIVDSPKRVIDASRGAYSTTREEADALMSRGEDLFDRLVERGQKIEADQTHRIGRVWRGVEGFGRERINQAEARVERSLQSVLGTLNIPSMDDIKRLDKDLDRLNRKLEAQIKDRQLATLPITNYDELTAKEIIAQLDELDEPGLEMVKEYESAHGQRKTVLRDLDRMLAADNA